jgi:hypothetical protein
LLEKNISELTVRIMILKDLLERQEVYIDEVQVQVKSVQEIVDNIKRII